MCGKSGAGLQKCKQADNGQYLKGNRSVVRCHWHDQPVCRVGRSNAGGRFLGHIQMLLKSILLGTTNWLRNHRYESVDHCGPALDDEGLLVDEFDGEGSTPCGHDGITQRGRSVQAVTTLERRESAEQIHEGFNRLVDQLQKINDHLGQQLNQHEELMSRVRQLPQLLESFPLMVESQRQLSSDLLGQMQTAAARQEQFLNAVGQIPTETARQTRALGAIHNQLEMAAQTDTELVTCFNRVGRTLNQLDTNTADNTAGMQRLRKSAAARDRYLAFALSKFQRRIVWMFAGLTVLCVAAISVIIGLVVYLRM
jgi:hypothetical protein